jgi:hypothetical protein
MTDRVLIGFGLRVEDEPPLSRFGLYGRAEAATVSRVTLGLDGVPRNPHTTVTARRMGMAMSFRPAAESVASDHGPSNLQTVCRAVLGIWAYSAVCGAVAVGVGDSAAAIVGVSLPASWVRLGAVGVVVVVAGLCGEKVLGRIDEWFRTVSLPRSNR